MAGSCSWCNAAVRDPASAANTADFRIEHFDLSVCTSFDKLRLFGCLTAQTKRLNAAASTCTLDVHHLDVALVQAAPALDAASWTTLAFSQKSFSSFGSALDIKVDPAVFGSSDTAYFKIYYSNRPSAPALSWLDAPKTANKTHPFLFTQGQACLNRSFFPCQDTPSVRSSWSATVVVPKDFTAVMSAPMVNEVKDGRGVGTPIAADSDIAKSLYPPVAGFSAEAFPAVDFGAMHAFSARMPQTVPIYLVALAVGDLRAADVGPRSRVWAEACQVDKAAWEFGTHGVTEAYLAAAESMFGPYVWGRYDILVMPPSFPFGGMENPTATFVTSALLAGDQSLCDVIAHEIAHSWTGNLVTNADWSRFFLNEGFTMFLQRRITQAVHGRATTALENVTGRTLLRGMVRDYGTGSELSRLIVPLESGIDPDETYTEAPYEKGYAFVSYLRACVGSESAFDAWLKSYTGSFAMRSVGHVEMLDHFFTHFPHLKGDWSPEKWIAEEAAEASSWWTVEGVPPANLEDSGILPALPMPTGAGVAVGDLIVDDKGRKGLAYRPGYEFMRWLHAPGWPVYYPPLGEAKELSAPAEALATAWLTAAAASAAGATGSGAVAAGMGADAAPLSAAFPSWPTLQKQHFLDTLVAAAEANFKSVPHTLLHDLDAAYGLSKSGNAEIRLRWSQLVALTVCEPFFPSIREFLQSTGKLKYVTPVFRALIAAPCVGDMAGATSAAAADGAATGAAGKVYPARQFAVCLYVDEKLRDSLHPAVQSRVDGVLSAVGLPTHA